MASEIRVPRLGWSMEQGVFLGWRKREGDRVEPGDILYELEGEKAAQEIEALDAGILHIAPSAPAAGETVPVGALLGYLANANETIVWDEPTQTPTAAPIAQAAPESSKQASEPLSGAPEAATAQRGRRATAPPSVRRLARELGVSLEELATSASVGRITRELVQAARDGLRRLSESTGRTQGEGNGARNRATPRARRAARRMGISLDHIRGSGRHGRIRERDVLAAAGSQAAPISGSVRIPVSRRRDTIARRMQASQQQTAPVTLTTRVDATNLVSLRSQFKAGGEALTVPSYTVIAAKLVALALARHPEMAAQWHEDALLLPDRERLDIGIAVDTEWGLVVPVMRDVTNTGLRELAARSVELIERARVGTLTASDLEGGHFTITNLGAYGIDGFTPIINYPQCAILGLGAIRREAVFGDDGQFTAREQMTLSLTFDHRRVDGAPSARFLATVRSAFENPSAWLLK